MLDFVFVFSRIEIPEAGVHDNGIVAQMVPRYRTQ